MCPSLNMFLTCLFTVIFETKSQCTTHNIISLVLKGLPALVICVFKYYNFIYKSLTGMDVFGVMLNKKSKKKYVIQLTVKESRYKTHVCQIF